MSKQQVFIVTANYDIGNQEHIGHALILENALLKAEVWARKSNCTFFAPLWTPKKPLHNSYTRRFLDVAHNKTGHIFISLQED